MTYRPAIKGTVDTGHAVGRNASPGPHDAFRGKNRPEAYSDVCAMKLRLDQLEAENLALQARVNQLIMSLSKTLMRGAVRS